MADAKQWEDQLIEEMRAHGGAGDGGPAGGTSTDRYDVEGAKSGEPRRAILTYSSDGDDQIVGRARQVGRRQSRAWIHNLEANPK